MKKQNTAINKTINTFTSQFPPVPTIEKWRDWVGTGLPGNPWTVSQSGTHQAELLSSHSHIKSAKQPPVVWYPRICMSTNYMCNLPVFYLTYTEEAKGFGFPEYHSWFDLFVLSLYLYGGFFSLLAHWKSKEKYQNTFVKHTKKCLIHWLQFLLCNNSLYLSE